MKEKKREKTDILFEIEDHFKTLPPEKRKEVHDLFIEYQQAIGLECIHQMQSAIYWTEDSCKIPHALKK